MGFVIGSVLTMILGFSWGGWTTSSTVERLATERASAATNEALVPVCLEKSKGDPARAKVLAELKGLGSLWQQREAVAEACVSQLLKVAEK